MSYAYDGATWREISEFWAYDGATWREIQEAWVYDGSVWRLVHEVSSCACGTANIDSTAQNYDPTGCTCTSTPKVLHFSKTCIKWTYTADDLTCQKAQIQYNIGGGSYITVTEVELNQSSGTAGSPCSGSAYEGFWSSVSCVTDTRQYRVRAVLSGGGTVCDTGVTQNTRNCIV